MRALLDVNVLIALFDPDHVSHELGMSWFAKHAKEGWASCPLTQNGCVRIMSSPSYPNTQPVHLLVRRLAEACTERMHEFWPDARFRHIRYNANSWTVTFSALPCGTAVDS